MTPTIKHPSIKFTISGFFIKLMIFGVPIFALILHDFQFLVDEKIKGIVSINADTWFFAIYVIWTVVLATLYPSAVKRPSDIFPTFYIPIVCLCGSVYWNNTGLMNELMASLMLALLIFPVVAMKAMSRISFHAPPIKFIKLYSDKNLPKIFLIIISTAVVFGYAINGDVGGFDMSSSYDRRMAGRITFADHTFARYLFDNAMNGVLPIFAFIAGRKKSLINFSLAMLFALFNFWLLGTKATFFYIAVMFFIGMMCEIKKQDKLPFYFSVAITTLFAVAMAEFLVNGRSIIADYIIRRVFMAGVQIQAYYMDAVFNGHDLPLFFITGIQSDLLPTFFIGEAYFGSADTNANTNAFFYEMARSGIPGLLFCVIFICVFFFALDKMYKKTGSDNVIGIASLYTLFLLEQAFTTALVSSGIFLCFILVLLARNQSQPPVDLHYKVEGGRCRD